MNLPPWFRTMLIYKGYFFLIMYPILLSVIIFASSNEYKQQMKGAFILLLMSGYWITEVIPIYVTALIPTVLGPLFGIENSNSLSMEYMRDSIMLFLGGAFLAIATEHRNLHRRIGVAVLRIVGTDPRMLMIGLMTPTWFMSMWMSNAAATIMMLTIVEALLIKLKIANNDDEERLIQNNNAAEAKQKTDKIPEVKVVQPPKIGSTQDQPSSLDRLGTGLSLGICFASTCGGMSTIIGTPTNVVVYGMLISRYNEVSNYITFGTWAAYAFPMGLILLIITWVLLCMMFIGFKKFFSGISRDKARTEAIKNILDEETEILGSMSYAEGTVLFVLILTILLWISRKPGAPGWSRFMPTRMASNQSHAKPQDLVTDTTPAMFSSLLLMVLPAFNPFRRDPNPDETNLEKKIRRTEVVLPWKVAAARCPWEVPIIIGGGFALAKICSKSGLSALIGQKLEVLDRLPIIVLIYVLVIVSSTLTTFVANAATATILIPVILNTSEFLRCNPLYLALPTTLAASLAFILPAATPANAIVFSKDRVPLKDMIKSGFVLILLGQLVVVMCTITYAVPILNLKTYPDWANNPVTGT